MVVKVVGVAWAVVKAAAREAEKAVPMEAGKRALAMAKAAVAGSSRRIVPVPATTTCAGGADRGDCTEREHFKNQAWR